MPISRKKRRLKLRLAAAGSLLLLLTGLLVYYAVWIEPDRLTVQKLELEIQDQRWLAPLRVVVAGDMHFRPRDGERLERVVRAINRLDPDLVILLGDYVAGRDFAVALAPETIASGFRKIRSPLGTFAILGNHDYWCGADRVTAAFQAAGIPVLINQTLPLEVASGFTINLAGVDDYTTGHDLLKHTLGQADDRFPTLLLTHHPDLIVQIPAARAVLVLAGHTHGGQVRIPGYGPPIVPSGFGKRYAEGLVMQKGTPPIFITRGIGTSILRLRFNCPPEIALLILRPAEPAQHHVDSFIR